MAVLVEQFHVYPGYWILKNNGDRGRKGDEKWDISESELLANVSALILLEELAL